jgi:hypothetical protein
MGQYSEEDKKAFKKKDMLNARFSALKCAGINNEGKGVDAKDMLIEADKYYGWLYPDVSLPDTKPAETVNVLPTPTVAQAKVLEKIAAELNLNVEDIKSKVLNIAERDYNIRKYPENVKSVNVFVNKLKG